MYYYIIQAIHNRLFSYSLVSPTQMNPLLNTANIIKMASIRILTYIVVHFCFFFYSRFFSAAFCIYWVTTCTQQTAPTTIFFYTFFLASFSARTQLPLVLKRETIDNCQWGSITNQYTVKILFRFCARVFLISAKNINCMNV